MHLRSRQHPKPTVLHRPVEPTVGFFALMLLLVFIVIYALTFWLTLSGTYESFIGNDNDFFHSFSTTLVGLVCGIVALALGQQSAPRSRRRSSTRHANDNLENQTGGGHEYLVTVEQWREYLAIAYVLAYFILA